METWLAACGATGLDDLCLSDFPSTGRGIKTLRPFKQGETLLTIPRDSLWTVDHAHGDALLGPALRSARGGPPLSVEDTLATYILFVRSRREANYDGPRSHLAALPVRYSSSIFFSDDELDVCAGSSLYTVTKHLQRRIEDDYRALDAGLFGRYRELFPREGGFTIDDYKWALCTVWSRAMDFVLPPGGQKSIRLLAPFADMLNHSPEVKQCHVYDPSSGNLSVLAGKNYDVGDQAFIYYGAIPNSRLLRLYGFVIADNPHDNYDLVLATHPAAPLFETKHKLWAAAGLDSTCTVSLTLSEPLPKNVLRYLRIQRAYEPDIAVMELRDDAAAEKFSDANEAEVLRSLAESFGGLLDSFGTKSEVLEQRLAEGVFSPGGSKWAAAHVSLGEQRVLRLARQRAEELLVAVESGNGKRKKGCANCGEEAAGQLMLCGRCQGVAYCGRTCQVAHYKEHKAMCRAIPSRHS